MYTSWLNYKLFQVSRSYPFLILSVKTMLQNFSNKHFYFYYSQSFLMINVQYPQSYELFCFVHLYKHLLIIMIQPSCAIY